MLRGKKKLGDKKYSKLSVFSVILLVCLVAYTVSFILPMAWALLASLKDYNEFNVDMIGIPKTFLWENYSYVFRKVYIPVDVTGGTKNVGIPMMFFYSALYSIGCAFFQTLVPCIVAYLCARFKENFSKVVYTTVIVTMILPIVGSLPAEIQMAKDLGLYDNIWGLWLMKANFLGMYFLVFYAEFKGMPMAYTEAAKIDGANNWRVLLTIIMPMIKNTFLTVMLINFINFWNEYQVPMIYLPSYPTIAVGMFKIKESSGSEFARVPYRLAGSLLMLVPILVVFLAVHEKLIGNLSVGGIKG
jgi:ABC-type glycerol-3-phosphate transport system permease component